MFGGTKCRTIDKVDIFGDSSGVALYRLDGNANDTGGNYHGTETAVTYGGGVYERGAVFTSANSSKIATPSIPITTTFSVSWWVKSANTTRAVNVQLDGNNSILFYYRTDNNTIEITTDFQHTCPSNTTGEYYDGNWHLLTITYNGTTTKFYKDTVEVALTKGVATTKSTTITTLGGRNSVGGYYWNGSQDQVRIFNRAITATEVATLFAECAPTSIVDNANPFEDNSLKAMYQFNGNANDLTGVYNGTATNVTYSAGKFGRCAVFNGSTSFVNTNYTLPTNSQATISFWHKNTSLATSQTLYADNTTVSTVTARCQLRLYQSKFTVHVSNGSSEYEVANIAATAADKLDDGSFHHIAMTYNGTSVKLYVDGILEANLTSTVAFGTAGSGAMNFGRYGNYATQYTFGSFDQVRIFNKALTPMEVAALYTETTPMEEPLAYRVDPFKDGSGKALYRLEGNALDESGNYNGTPTSVTYGNGISGRCFVGDGTVRKISIPALGFTSLNYSVSVWANFTNLTNYPTVIQCYSGAMFGIFYDDAQTKLSVQVFDGAWKRVDYAISINTDYHVVLTVGANVLKLYINGTYINQVAVGSLANVGGGSYIGTYYDGSQYPMKGKVDQVRIFNKALTQTEVTKLYTNLA